MMMSRKSLGIVALGLLAAVAAGPLMGDVALAGGKVKATIDGKKFSSTSQATTAVAVTSPPYVTINATKVNIRTQSTASITILINVDLTTLATPATIPAFTTTYGYGGIGGVQETYFGQNTINVTIKKFKNNKIIGTFEGTLAPGATGSGGPPVSVERGKIKVKLAAPPI